MRVIPVFGFLGSGKTTTILDLAHHITDRRQRVAVLVNEAGEVPVDGTVLRAGGHEVVELFAGCLCLMRDDLYDGLVDIAQMEGVDWVLIEPSGMVNALRLSRLLQGFQRFAQPEVAAHYSLHKQLGIVDAARYPLLMRSAPHLIRQSIQMADVLFLNKVDIVDGRRLAEVEAEVRPMMKTTAELERVSASHGLPLPVLDRVLTGP